MSESANSVASGCSAAMDAAAQKRDVQPVCDWKDDDGVCGAPATYLTPWCMTLCDGHATIRAMNGGVILPFAITDSQPDTAKSVQAG